MAEELNKKTAKATIRRHYDRLYRTETSDSPDGSRADMNRAIMEQVRAGRVDPARILSIGSGPQVTERTLLKTFTDRGDRASLKRIFFVTTDIAHIDRRNLAAKMHTNVGHMQSDAEMLPFKDGTFGMVASNMAIDLMPRAALRQAAAALVS